MVGSIDATVGRYNPVFTGVDLRGSTVLTYTLPYWSSSGTCETMADYTVGDDTAEAFYVIGEAAPSSYSLAAVPTAPTGCTTFPTVTIPSGIQTHIAFDSANNELDFT
jgi:hypothetical protein